MSNKEQSQCRPKLGQEIRKATSHELDERIRNRFEICS